MGSAGKRGFPGNGGDPQLNPYLPLVQELLALFPALEIQQVRPKYRKIVDIAQGWYTHVENGCRAVLLLEDEGLALEAAPIRRSVIEHTVALKWLVHDGEKIIPTLQRSAKYGWDKLGKANTEAGWQPLDPAGMKALEDIASRADPRTDFLSQFTARADRLKLTHDKVTYLHETAYSHPSIESANLYRVDAPPRDLDQLGFCVMYLFDALAQFDQLFDPQPWLSVLPSIGQKIKDVTAARRAEDGLPIPGD